MWNLHAPQFGDEQAEIIARARAAGVGLMVNWHQRPRLQPAGPCWPWPRPIQTSGATVGTHPHEAKEDPELSAADGWWRWPRHPRAWSASARPRNRLPL